MCGLFRRGKGNDGGTDVLKRIFEASPKSFQFSIEEFEQLQRDGRITFSGYPIIDSPIFGTTKIGDVQVIKVDRGQQALPEARVKIESMGDPGPDGKREMVFVLIKE